MTTKVRQTAIEMAMNSGSERELGMRAGVEYWEVPEGKSVMGEDSENSLSLARNAMEMMFSPGPRVSGAMIFLRRVLLE